MTQHASRTIFLQPFVFFFQLWISLIFIFINNTVMTARTLADFSTSIIIRAKLAKRAWHTEQLSSLWKFLLSIWFCWIEFLGEKVSQTTTQIHTFPNTISFSIKTLYSNDHAITSTHVMRCKHTQKWLWVSIKCFFIIFQWFELTSFFITKCSKNCPLHFIVVRHFHATKLLQKACIH
jgi:hypothetical protein